VGEEGCGWRRGRGVGQGAVWWYNLGPVPLSPFFQPPKPPICGLALSLFLCLCLLLAPFFFSSPQTRACLGITRAPYSSTHTDRENRRRLLCASSEPQRVRSVPFVVAEIGDDARGWHGGGGGGSGGEREGGGKVRVSFSFPPSLPYPS
jgi:hypothetical protein